MLETSKTFFLHSMGLGFKLVKLSSETVKEKQKE
jgi:hypothetical protein